MRRYRMSRLTKEPRTTQKEAAWEIMEEAYLKASGNGRYPALARQIYYQARPGIMGSYPRQGSWLTDIFRRPDCPTISKKKAWPGTLSTTLAGISKNRTPIGASASERLKSVITCTR